MSDDATIEDEVEIEDELSSSRPETKTGLLPWSFIFEIGKSIYFLDDFCILIRSFFYLVAKQWAVFLIISITIAIFLYVNGPRRQNKKETSSAIRHDHIQGGSKGISRKSPKRE